MSNATPTQQQFHLRPASLADLPSIARLWTSSFFDDEILGDLMHPHRTQYPDDVYFFHLRGLRERFFSYRHQFIVVSTPDGTIAGAADWRRLGPGGSSLELSPYDPRNLISPVLHGWHSLAMTLWPNRAADPSKSSFLDNAVASSNQHWTGERAECWDLHICGVDPEFQGKGVGKMLASWGVERAKKEEKEGEKVVASVLCAEKNRGFYGKCGFGVDVAGKGREEGIVLFTR